MRFWRRTGRRRCRSSSGTRRTGFSNGCVTSTGSRAATPSCKDYVRSRRQSTREAFVPLHHLPGHAQVDFGEAVVEVGGRRDKVALFYLILPHSDLWFVKAYPKETTEAFLDGHVSVFAFLGGVPLAVLYDNTTLAVARILGDGTRQRTQAFTHLQSHYLFRDRFGRPGKGNDKGQASNCTSFRRCVASWREGGLFVSFRPGCLTGGWSPGGS